MKTPGAHAHEDRLLDFAYDELPRSEAHAVEQHLQDCARCSEALRGIRGVRRTMARLPLETEPSAGLDSLLAYAQQSARRAAAGAEPAPRWWRRLMAPALGMAAVSLFGVVVLQVNREVDLNSALQKSSASDRTVGAPAPAAALAPPPPPAAAPAPASERAHTYAQAPDARSLEGELSQNWGNAGPGGGRAEKKGVARALVAEPKDSEAPGELARLEDSASSGPPPAVQAAPGAPTRARESRSDKEESWAAKPARPASKSSGAVGGIAMSAPSPSARDSAGDDDYDQVPRPAQAAARKAAPAPMAEEPPAKQGSPSPAELLRQAELSRRAGDRGQEVAFLRAALSAGAWGSEALGALSQLCDAETVLGHLRSAVEVCKRVVATAPGSSEAREAERLLQGPLRSTSHLEGAEPAEAH